MNGKIWHLSNFDQTLGSLHRQVPIFIDQILFVGLNKTEMVSQLVTVGVFSIWLSPVKTSGGSLVRVTTY